MPPEKATSQETKRRKAQAPDLAASEAKPQIAAMAPEYDRLLSKGQGVIDAFETLGLLVIRLIDKERESLEQANPGATAPYPKIDEADLDRRYREELDRICNPRTEA